MTFAAKNTQILFFIAGVNQTVCFVNSAAIPFYMLKWFRLAYSSGWAVTLNILYQIIDFLECLFVLGMPLNVFLKGFWGKNEVIHLPWP